MQNTKQSRWKQVSTVVVAWMGATLVLAVPVFQTYVEMGRVA